MEKTGENRRKREETGTNQKNLQKTVDKHSRRVYNMQACLTDRRSPLFEKEVSCMAAAGVRVKITLACTECKQRNYNTMKNKRNNPDRIEMSKYCRFCKKHTVHKETR